jgi:hypothetical protein
MGDEDADTIVGVTVAGQGVRATLYARLLHYFYALWYAVRFEKNPCK